MSLNYPSSNWSNRPPKETILLDGCEYEHWLIVMEFPTDHKPSEEEIINSYVKTLATVVGSEEEEKKKIFSVCRTTYTGFGALVSKELSHKVKDLPGVLWVLPDSYLDVPNKDYGGDLFVDGKVIHRPQYRTIDPMRGNRPGAGLALAIIDAERQCRLKEENQEHPGPQISKHHHSVLRQSMGKMHLRVMGPVTDQIRLDFMETMCQINLYHPNPNIPHK